MAGILLTVATIGAAVFAFTSADAGASKGRSDHHVRHARAKHLSAADAHLCGSLDHLIRFLQKSPKPSALKTRAGRAVLRDLASRPPGAVAANLGTVVQSFSTIRDHGTHSLTKAQDAAASDALFRVAVYGASHCPQQTVRGFGSALVRSRIAKAEASTSTTTKR